MKKTKLRDLIDETSLMTGNVPAAIMLEPKDNVNDEAIYLNDWGYFYCNRSTTDKGVINRSMKKFMRELSGVVDLDRTDWVVSPSTRRILRLHIEALQAWLDHWEREEDEEENAA